MTHVSRSSSSSTAPARRGLSADPVHRGKLDPLGIGLPELREELASSYLRSTDPSGVS
jgi:hypothetical protein